jgi:hypothetical protein
MRQERNQSAAFTAGKVCFGSNVTALISASVFPGPQQWILELADALRRVFHVPRWRALPGFSYCGVGMPLNQTSYTITNNITVSPTTLYQRRLSLKSIGPPPMLTA